MNIIIGEEVASEVDGRYILLELDSIKIAVDQSPVRTYCLIEKITLEEIFNIEQCQKLHSKLIENYRKKNWKFCLDAIDHLKGNWNRELDSFYTVLESRILDFQLNDPGEEWNGVIDKTSS